MSDRPDPLDEALASLPKSIQPTRDLWADVRKEIAASEARPAASPGRFLPGTLRRTLSVAPGWHQLAASVLLVVATAATTFVLTRQSLQDQAPTLVHEATPAPLVTAMPVSFATESLGPDYIKARAALDAQFEQRIAALPPATRAKLQSDLADLRRAANEIAATLAQHPSDPLLQNLLMSTYQSELQLFADVNQMTTRTLRTDL